MGYEYLSTIIVFIIVLIGIVAWLPVSTINSMRHVEEHREDRYSTSLRLIDADSGTRFSDERNNSKGVSMQPNERRVTTLSPAYIAQVRHERRQAVRRRQIIVAALVVVTIVVLALAFGLHYSPLFALIPAAMTAAVLALGAHAARQAREWERKVSEAKARSRRSAAARVKAKAAQQTTATNVGERTVMDDSPTYEMERREIRRVLREAQAEQARALAERAQAAGREAAPVVEATPVAVEPDVVSSDERAAVAPAAQPASVERHGEPAAQTEAQTSDATAELAEVRPARALDAFDMATSPELISFSLGEARNIADEPEEAPESREIKSARQVAKATPVDTAEQRSLAAEAVMETEPAAQETEPAAQSETKAKEGEPNGGHADTSADDELMAQATRADVTDVASFHQSEEQAKVAVPAATSDSLGRDLQAILARRGA